MPIVGIGASAPAVVAGEFAAAQPAGSPTVPTQIQVPTPTMGARAEDLQIMAQATIDGLKAIKDTAITLSALKTFADGIAIAQTKAITANGTGATIAGTWLVTGNVGFQGGSVNFDEDISVAAGRTLTCVSSPVLGAGDSLAITGATNATPIVITSSGHSLVDGQQVTIASVGGNTAANGTWVVDVLSGSTFSLVGSAGNGSYTAATGTVAPTAEVKFIAARTITRACPSTWNDGGGALPGSYTATWYTDNQGRFKNTHTSPTSVPQFIGFNIDLPQGAVLTSATVCFTPKGGHGAVPITVPQVNVYKIDLRTGTPSSALATADDPNTGSTGAYQVFTALTATLGTPEIVDNSRFRYHVVLTTETGTNADDGTTVQGAYCAFSTQFLDQF